MIHDEGLALLKAPPLATCCQAGIQDHRVKNPGLFRRFNIVQTSRPWGQHFLFLFLRNETVLFSVQRGVNNIHSGGNIKSAESS